MDKAECFVKKVKLVDGYKVNVIVFIDININLFLKRTIVWKQTAGVLWRG
jgi:hypothetical protein